MEYVYIGKIVNTHGIKGELRIKSNFDKKDLVFKPGITFYIGEGYVPEEVVTYRKHKDFDMVTFKGYTNINEVLNYVKHKVYVNRDDLKLNNNEYLLDDLIGMSVIENGEVLGTVRDIEENGINILLCVSGSKDFYIPKHDNFIKEVKLDSKEIIVENAKGLIL